ncbi:hypothetical protein M3Y98_01008700 [Aphelenchoides besseyi]|nr:hypothetical protein M3Y98_01008700 [Aphelenchoides besseyi]
MGCTVALMILVVGWLVGGAPDTCSIVPGKKTFDFGVCKSGSGNLKVDGEELDFKVLYDKNGPGKAKFFTDGFTIGDGSDARDFSCGGYNPSETEKVVEFNFTTHDKITGLKVEFENAMIFEVPEGESKWSVKSWRLWLTICNGVMVFLLLLIAIGASIWCSVKHEDKKKALANGEAVPAKASKKKQLASAKANQPTTGGIQMTAKKQTSQKNKSLTVRTAKPLIDLDDKQTAVLVHEIINEEMKEVVSWTNLTCEIVSFRNTRPRKVVKDLEEEANPPKPVDPDPPSVSPAPVPTVELPNKLIGPAGERVSEL